MREKKEHERATEGGPGGTTRSTECDPEKARLQKLEHAEKKIIIIAMSMRKMRDEEADAGRQDKTMDNVMKNAHTHTQTLTQRHNGRADTTQTWPKRGRERGSERVGLLANDRLRRPTRGSKLRQCKRW